MNQFDSDKNPRKLIVLFNPLHNADSMHEWLDLGSQRGTLARIHGMAFSLQKGWPGGTGIMGRFGLKPKRDPTKILVTLIVNMLVWIEAKQLVVPTLNLATFQNLLHSHTKFWLYIGIKPNIDQLTLLYQKIGSAKICLDFGTTN